MDVAVPNKRLKMDTGDVSIPSVASLLTRIAELEQELAQSKLAHQSEYRQQNGNGVDRVLNATAVKEKATNSSWDRYLLRKPVENTHPATTSKEIELECARRNNLDMDQIDRTMFWRPSYETTISCGFVAVDLKRRLVLSIYNKKLGIYQLPKGRTKINENFLEAAVRETIEESGVTVTPLPLLNWTRANRDVEDTPYPVNGAARKPHNKVIQACPDRQVVSDTLNNEFIGVVDYMDPQVSTPNTHKSIYYFAASFDVEAHEAGTSGQRYEDKFVPCAYSLEDTLKVLRFKADRDAVNKLVDDLRLTNISF